ncbi:MAG: hypothetical protein R3E97_23205 [Candidatus Eisenbacteria bacterium]
MIHRCLVPNRSTNGDQKTLNVHGIPMKERKPMSRSATSWVRK